MATTARNRIIFIALALAAAAVFVRLGVWQLHRRVERLARNALVTHRYDAPSVDVASLPRDTADARFRRVRVIGQVDYDHELTYASRSYKGSPGVNLMTPVHLPGSDTVVIVDRGWVYSPDGSTLDHTKWHDVDSTFVGYVEEMPSTGGTSFTSKPTVIAHLSYPVVAKALPYPVLPFYVVALGDSANAPDRVARLSLPPLDAGPHLSYAIQWFCFAIIAVVGAAIVVRRGDG
ncbi:MAG TPA: SURF1 family protein [Gemmatimonadaceae bacterium]|jgi:surfeit locus 1 family protein|nr:SURF1 family protein [Gemmatimonadaceae bacterium]